MEQFDVLNIHGEPTGKRVAKGSELSSGEYYLGAHAYIHNAAYEFLLQQRSLNKVFLPGGWDIHMGHVVAGETSQEGIAREIREEIGLCPPNSEIRFVGRVLWEEYHHMVDIYFLEIDYRLNGLSLQKEEVIGVKAVPWEEMLELVAGMEYRPPEYRGIVLAEIGSLARSL